MPFSTYAEKATLDAWLGGQAPSLPATLYWAFFTTVPTRTDASGTECVNGGYVRTAQTNNLTNFPAAASGGANAPSTKSNATAVVLGPVTADLSSGATVVGWALCDNATPGAGHYILYGELLGPAQAYVTETVAGVCTATAHGYSNNDAVRVRNTSGGNVPTGLSGTYGGGTKYYIVQVTTNTFKLSLTQGGSAIIPSTTGDGANTVAKDYFQTVT